MQIRLKGEKRLAERLNNHLCSVAAAVIGSAVVGGAISSSAAKSAASTQADAANNATQTQLDMFNTTNAQQAPYREAGYTALNQLNAGTAPGGQFTHTFNNADLNSNLAPNYQFQLDQGLGAVNNQNSVTGGLVSGNALKGINDYAQNFAGNAYQNAFNNYNVNQSNIFNRLSSIAGLGQTSVGQTTTAGQQYAGQIGSGQLAYGAATAAGTMGSAKAISGALNNASSWYVANHQPSINPTGFDTGTGGSGYNVPSGTQADMLNQQWSS